MHKSRLGEVTIDCPGNDLEAAAEFWSSVFGYQASKYENHYVLKTPKNEVLMNIQTVEHPARVHLDIETDDIQAEVARLEKLGAKRIRKARRWWVMEAPTGHRFCVVRIGRTGFDEGATEWK